MKPETVSVTCAKCGMTLPVPVGGKRLCGCGAWISAASGGAAVGGALGGPSAPPMAAVPVEIPMEAPPVAPPTRTSPAARPAPPPLLQPAEAFPRIEGDLAAIERLNDGYRRIIKELGK